MSFLSVFLGMFVRIYDQVVQTRAPSGPFKLNPEIIADIEKDWVRADQIPQTKLAPLDISNEESICIKPSNGFSYPTERLTQLLSKCPPRPHSANVTMYSASSPQHFVSPPRPTTAPAPELTSLMETSPKLDAKLLNMIKGIGHPDRLVSHASLNELSDILESPEKQAVLRDYDEIYIESVLEQFKVTFFKANEILITATFDLFSTCHSDPCPKQCLFISHF